jgi:hypothetical protein
MRLEAEKARAGLAEERMKLDIARRRAEQQQLEQDQQHQRQIEEWSKTWRGQDVAAGQAPRTPEQYQQEKFNSFQTMTEGMSPEAKALAVEAFNAEWQEENVLNGVGRLEDEIADSLRYGSWSIKDGEDPDPDMLKRVTNLAGSLEGISQIAKAGNTKGAVAALEQVEKTYRDLKASHDKAADEVAEFGRIRTFAESVLAQDPTDPIRVRLFEALRRGTMKPDEVEDGLIKAQTGQVTARARDRARKEVAESMRWEYDPELGKEGAEWPFKRKLFTVAGSGGKQVPFDELPFLEAELILNRKMRRLHPDLSTFTRAWSR